MRILTELFTQLTMSMVVGTLLMLAYAKHHASQHDPIQDLIDRYSYEEWRADEVLFGEIVAAEQIRLEAFGRTFPTVKADLHRFLDFVKIVESDGNPMAQAATSTAMSLFQFTIPSVTTAVNRLENYMARHFLGPLPDWAGALREEPTTLFYVPETRQAILTLVNIAERRGSDELIRSFLEGEATAAKDIYLLHHHTDPDLATRIRTERVFIRFFGI